MKRRLKQTKQCATCPWKANSNLQEIPGYDPQQHQELWNTIADPDRELSLKELRDICDGTNTKTKIMACHHSPSESNEEAIECVGYLHNQLTAGSVPLKVLIAVHYEEFDFRQLQLDGKQKANFSETFSK